MHHMGDWRDKDDLDLTSEDLGAMFDAGIPVEMTHVRPREPFGVIVTGPACTYGSFTFTQGYSSTPMKVQRTSSRTYA